MCGERAKRRLAVPPLALVDVVHDVIGEAGEHRLEITGIEGGEVAPDQGLRLHVGMASSGWTMERARRGRLEPC
jgi:hypothetical protein